MRAAAIALALLCAALPTSARADESCAIEGTLQGISISVRSERGQLRRVQLTASTRVSVTPIRAGLSRVRTLDEPILDGTTRAPVRLVLARAIELRSQTIELPEGLPIDRHTVTPTGAWLEVDATLGDGLFLRRAPLPCSALTVIDADRAIVPLEDRTPQSGPRWHARTTRLYLFDREDGEEPLRLEVAPAAAARFIELSRRGPWVNVVIRTVLGSRMRGWVHDWDLVR